MTAEEALHELYPSNSRADMADIVSDLRALGYVIVPVEPSETIVIRAAKAIVATMFAAHELPIGDLLFEQYCDTTRAAYAAIVGEAG